MENNLENENLADTLVRYFEELTLEKRLVYLITKRDYETIQEILQNEKDDDKFYFLRENHFFFTKYKFVKLLLENNIPFDTQQILKFYCDDYSGTNDIGGQKRYRMVKLLLENGVDVHFNDDNALICSSRNGYYEIVKLLLENGADVHAWDDAAIIECAIYDHHEIVELLLKNGVDVNAPGSYILLKSVLKCHFRTVEILLKNGARIETVGDFNWNFFNSCTDCDDHAKCDHYRTIKLLLEYEIDVAAYGYKMVANFLSNSEITKLLLEYGVNIYINQDMNLRFSAQYGNLLMVKLLLENGARIDTYDYPSNFNSTLGDAAERGHYDIVKLLLEYGADIHAINECALYYSSAFGHLEIVKLLLEHGADVNTKQEINPRIRKTREYPLIVATKNGHNDVVELLLKNGADANAENNDVLTFACQHDNDELVALLLNYSTNLNLDQCHSLRIAVENDSYHSLKLLLQYGADPHLDDDLLLKIAAEKNCCHVVELLLENGVNASAKDTALEIATKHGNEKISQILLGKN